MRCSNAQLRLRQEVEWALNGRGLSTDDHRSPFDPRVSTLRDECIERSEQGVFEPSWRGDFTDQRAAACRFEWCVQRVEALR